MTLIKHEGKMQIICDACPATYRRTYAEEDFKILLQDIKDEQWRIERKADAWTHTCPDCWKWADRRLF